MFSDEGGNDGEVMVAAVSVNCQDREGIYANSEACNSILTRLSLSYYQWVPNAVETSVVRAWDLKTR